MAVKDGAVTLTGRVPTYGEKLGAARAASRVYGVKAVADELQVRLAGEPRDDSDVARAIAHVLELEHEHSRGPGAGPGAGRLGDARRRGRLGLPAPRSRADGPACARRRRESRTTSWSRRRCGRTGSRLEIEEAFKREAEIDTRHINVEVSDHTAKLYGHVHSLNEATAATAAAAAAPGWPRWRVISLCPPSTSVAATWAQSREQPRQPVLRIQLRHGRGRGPQAFRAELKTSPYSSTARITPSVDATVSTRTAAAVLRLPASVSGAPPYGLADRMPRAPVDQQQGPAEPLGLRQPRDRDIPRAHRPRPRPWSARRPSG